MNDRNLALKENPNRRKASRLPAAEGRPSLTGRWMCNHHSDVSDIEAYVTAADGLEIIAQTRHAEGIDARANAELIVRAVNNYEKHQYVVNQLVASLELCLACEELAPEVRRGAKVALGRVGKS